MRNIYCISHIQCLTHPEQAQRNAWRPGEPLLPRRRSWARGRENGGCGGPVWAAGVLAGFDRRDDGSVGLGSCQPAECASSAGQPGAGERQSGIINLLPLPALRPPPPCLLCASWRVLWSLEYTSAINQLQSACRKSHYSHQGYVRFSRRTRAM